MTDATIKSKPKATSLPAWLAWLTLSALAWGGIVAVILLDLTPLDWFRVPMTDYFWLYQLRLEIMPVVGIAALASPVLGAVALIFRRWRPAALAMIGAVALAQFAYVGLELWFKAYPPEAPVREGLENWDSWPRAK